MLKKAVKQRQVTSLKPITYVVVFILLTHSLCYSQSQTHPPGEIGKLDPAYAFQLKNYTDADVVNCSFLDSQGNMWFGTSREGVFRYDGNSFTNFSVENGFCNNRTSAIMEDKNGNIIFGADDGLCIYNGELFTHIQIPPEVRPLPEDDPIGLYPRNLVLSLLMDRSGLIWLGTAGAGAYSFDGESFTNFLSEEGRLQPSDGLYRNVIQSMVEDNEGNIWFTSMTHGGISRYDGKSFTHFTTKDGLPDDMIFSSLVDSEGDIWFGTLDVGLIRFDGDTFSYFDESDGLINNMISWIYEDKEKKLWLASFRSSTVCWYDRKNFESFPADKENILTELRFISPDKDGNMWFGGRYGLLWQYDGEKLIDFTQEKNN